MSKTCGDFGGRCSDGEPCHRPRRQSPCPDHTEERKQARKIDPHEVEKLAAVLTQAQIGDFYGFTDRTLRRRLAEDPELVSAYTRGRARAVGNLGKTVYQMAADGDTRMLEFYLKTQGGWSTKHEHEISGPGGGAIPTEMTVTLVRPDDAGDY